jgi:hypothetical protein
MQDVGQKVVVLADHGVLKTSVIPHKPEAFLRPRAQMRNPISFFIEREQIGFRINFLSRRFAARRENFAE